MQVSRRRIGVLECSFPRSQEFRIGLVRCGISGGRRIKGFIAGDIDSSGRLFCNDTLNFSTI